MNEREPYSQSFEWEESPDLTSFPDEDIKSQLKTFAEQERKISYHRRVIQGRIDLLRAELVRRGHVDVAPEELATILLGDSPGEPERSGGQHEPGAR